MAQLTPLNHTLQLQFQVGTTASGSPKLQNHNYPHVAQTAPDDAVLQVGQAIGALFSEPLYGVVRIDQNSIQA